MQISSRTPEGYPAKCPLCDKETNLEFPEPTGDAPCPSCGCLLWRTERLADRVKQILATTFGVDPNRITSAASLKNFGADSLSMVELVMHVEEELDLDIDDSMAEQFNSPIATVGDLITLLASASTADGD